MWTGAFGVQAGDATGSLPMRVRGVHRAYPTAQASVAQQHFQHLLADTNPVGTSREVVLDAVVAERAAGDSSLSAYSAP